MEVFGHFVFPRFSGFFRAFPFVYRLFRAFLFTILFRHFVLPPIDEISNNLKSKIIELLSEDTSMDKIKLILNIPILILHECQITKDETELKDEYKENIIKFHKDIATKYFKKQIKNCSSVYLYSKIKFHLILFPVPDKSKIVDKFLTIAKAHK